ncbi:hypothetical protein [Streptomyces sp. KLOTTS4A1]|uniref:hypothetical protein n=1 Tax=Streptomyces sp. KLOTTS4A1 TaxID=3390996 RepID=UPI0039F49D84
MDTKDYRWNSVSARERWAEAEAQGKAEAKAEGRAEGKAEDVLRILGHRGIEVPAAQRDRILACRDLDRLDTWFDQALDITSADQLA